MSPAVEPEAPSDAQIAYFLARFVKNVRSLSADPIVVRANWTEAYEYVNGELAQALGNYARDTGHSTRAGMQPVTIEVSYVVRASNDAFEIRWKEQTYDNGLIIKTEMFTSVVSIMFRSRNAGETLNKNPLGLHIRAFNWSADRAADGTNNRTIARDMKS